jgi:hypothetical protein
MPNRYDSFSSFEFLRDIFLLLVFPIPYFERQMLITEYLGGQGEPTTAVFLLSDFILGKI